MKFLFFYILFLSSGLALSIGDNRSLIRVSCPAEGLKLLQSKRGEFSNNEKDLKLFGAVEAALFDVNHDRGSTVQWNPRRIREVIKEESQKENKQKQLTGFEKKWPATAQALKQVDTPLIKYSLAFLGGALVFVFLEKLNL